MKYNVYLNKLNDEIYITKLYKHVHVNVYLKYI